MTSTGDEVVDTADIVVCWLNSQWKEMLNFSWRLMKIKIQFFPFIWVYTHPEFYTWTPWEESVNLSLRTTGRRSFLFPEALAHVLYLIDFGLHLWHFSTSHWEYRYLIGLASMGLPLELRMGSLLPKQHYGREVDSQGKYRGYWMLSSK